MIIHTVIGNRTHPEYGVASIPFPIPTEEYPRSIEMLEALEIGDVRKSDCHIAEIESLLPVLKCLEDTDINVDELDYLAKRLDSFSNHELQQFQAMAAKNGYYKLKDLINLTFSCQQVTVISDFSDLEFIGRQHFLNTHYMKKAKMILLALMALLAIAGLVVTFKPLMERASRQKQVNEANDSFIQQLEQIQSVQQDTPEATPYAQLREQIEQYNTWLYEGKQIALTNAAAYEQPAFILTQYGLQDETFGIIYIPKLEVTLPLYLGANDENMANGAAVLGQTNVPIGGVNTNSVIAGHRGWNGYPYFLNLDELQIGDLVYIDNVWTLMKYEVVDIQVISPDDVDAIKIQEGRDLVTLLTCHPPNTGGRQRLLVFCERVVE